jgi:uncharacterized protein YkwD
VFLAAVALLLAGRGLIPRATTTLVRDDPACPHSSDFPQSDRDPAARAEILCLLNLERSKAGLPPFREDARLDLAAQVQSDDISAHDFFAHRNPEGKYPNDRILAAGYPPNSSTGENILWGEERYATPVLAAVYATTFGGPPMRITVGAPGTT